MDRICTIKLRAPRFSFYLDQKISHIIAITIMHIPAASTLYVGELSFADDLCTLKCYCI